jgi:hypothetical protein
VNADAHYDCQNFSSPCCLKRGIDSEKALPHLLGVVSGHGAIVKKASHTNIYGISAEVVGRGALPQQSLLNAHTRFTILVRNCWSTTTVYRRYSDFVALESQLQPIMNKLPQLPPKGFLTKFFSSVVNDPSFMNDRERGLGKFLEAVISFDPALRRPELRDFLGVPSCTLDGR